LSVISNQSQYLPTPVTHHHPSLVTFSVIGYRLSVAVFTNTDYSSPVTRHPSLFSVIGCQLAIGYWPLAKNNKTRTTTLFCHTGLRSGIPKIHDVSSSGFL